MSALGQKQTFASQKATSAYPQKRTLGPRLKTSAKGQERTTKPSVTYLTDARFAVCSIVFDFSEDNSVTLMRPDKPTLCPEDSVFELVKKLSCGNPGAVLILCKIASEDRDPYDLFFELDDLNSVGSRIWEVYKDTCREDFEDFVQRVRDRAIH
jgi:hypothetical protein